MSSLPTYRMFMMRQGVVAAIEARMKACDPMLVEMTNLLLNALTANKDACNMLFNQMRVKTVVIELLKLIKGLVITIPGAFYTAKTGTYALGTIYHIVRLQHKNAV